MLNICSCTKDVSYSVNLCNNIRNKGLYFTFSTTEVEEYSTITQLYAHEHVGKMVRHRAERGSKTKKDTKRTVNVGLCTESSKTAGKTKYTKQSL